MLTGLRGVGKTVLLNALRSQAVRKGWGTGKLEARPDQRAAQAAGERAAPGGPRARPPAAGARPTTRSACSAPSPSGEAGRRQAARPLEPRHRRRPPSAAGPTPATSRSTWSSCSPTSAGWPPTPARASRSSSTRCRTSAPTTSPRCAPPATRSARPGCRSSWSAPACRTCRRCFSASKSYSERLFSYQRIDRLTREEADRALTAPAAERGRVVRRGGAGRDVRRHRRLPLLRPGLRQDGLGPGPALADHRRRRRGRRARGRARAGGRVLRQPLRAGDPGGAGLPARDGRRRERAARRGRPTRSARSRPPTSRRPRARSRSRSHRPATRCSRRA